MDEVAKWDGNVSIALPAFPDDGTIYTHMFPRCKDCGAKDFVFRDEPFYALTDKTVVVAPVECKNCGYGYSIEMSLE